MCQVSYSGSLVPGAVGAASLTAPADSAAQARLLQHARTVLEAALQLAHAARRAGGNPRVSTLNLTLS